MWYIFLDIRTTFVILLTLDSPLKALRRFQPLFELGRVCFGVQRAVAKVWLRKELRSACHHRILPCILGPRPSFHNCMNEWLWMDWKLRSIPRLRISFLFMPLPLASRPLTDILENILLSDITLGVRLNYFGCLSLTVNVLTSTHSVSYGLCQMLSAVNFSLSADWLRRVAVYNEAGEE